MVREIRNRTSRIFQPSPDLLLVDGAPLSDVRILQDQKRLVAIMKDGKFHKEPESLSVGMSMGTGMRYTA